MPSVRQVAGCRGSMELRQLIRALGPRCGRLWRRPKLSLAGPARAGRWKLTYEFALPGQPAYETNQLIRERFVARL